MIEAGKAVSGIFGAVADGLDRLFTSDDERNRAKIEMARIGQEVDLAQIGVNKVEAGHPSIFVAGWRPFFGWVTGACYFASVAMALFGHWIDIPVERVEIAAEMTKPLGMALLGFSGYRTFEKWRGVARDNMQ